MSPPDAQPVRPRRSGRLIPGLRVVASTTLLSRVLGLVREIATASMFGLGAVSDAFTTAFRIPNLARRLFGEGALTNAFLPIFTRELERLPPDAAGRTDRTPVWELATAVFLALAVGLTGLILVAELGVCLALELGTWDEPARLLLGLTAVVLPYAVLICLAAQVTAVLHALNHFTWPAWVPVVMNVCWIGSVFFIDPYFEPDRIAQAYALAVCLVIAGVLQLALQWPVLFRLGYRFRWNWAGCKQNVQEILWAMIPVTLGLSITQINTLVDSVLAFSLSRPAGDTMLLFPQWGIDYPLEIGAVSALHYGEKLYQFPLGVFGVALGTVLFPLFARHAARGEMQHLRDDLTTGLALVVLIGFPASAGLILVAEPVTKFFFEHGKFTAEDASRTADVISTYGVGVWAYCAIPVLYRAFFAIGARQLPVLAGVCAVALDFVLNVTLVWFFAERGLAASTAISAMFQVGLLLWLVQKHIGRLDTRHLITVILKATLATAAMSAACWATAFWQRPTLPTSGDLLTPSVASWLPARLQSLLSRGLDLALPVTVGLAVYALFCWLLQLEELRLLLRSTPREPVDLLERPADDPTPKE